MYTRGKELSLSLSDSSVHLSAMATCSTIKPRTNSEVDSARTPKYVYLHDWWLIKNQTKGLAVGGFSNRLTGAAQGVRVFCSAAISRRHDVNTLETIDGFTISMSGFINRSRTLENGFSYEVCNRFLLGFPYNWEEYVAQFFGEDSNDGCVPTRVSAFDELGMSLGDQANSVFPVSLDDLPVTMTGDLLMTTLGNSGNCALTRSIFDDLLGKFGYKNFEHSGESVHLKMGKCNSKVDSARDDTLTNHKKATVNKMLKDRNAILDAPDSKVDSALDVTLSNHKRATVNKKFKDGNVILDAPDSKVDSAEDDTPSSHKKATVNKKLKDRNAKLDAPNSKVDFAQDGTPLSHKKAMVNKKLKDRNAKLDAPDSKVDSAQDGTPRSHTKAKVRNKLKDRNAILNASDLDVDSSQVDSLSNHKKAKVNKKFKDRNVILNTKTTDEDITFQSNMGITPNNGVATRSMTRRCSGNNHKETPSSNASVHKGIIDLSSSSEAAGNQHQGMPTRSSSNGRHARKRNREKS